MTTKTLRKQFKVHGLDFVTNVTLEKWPGKHEVICNCMGGWNYYEQRTTDSEKLELTILQMWDQAKEKTKARLGLSEDESVLQNIGFE